MPPGLKTRVQTSGPIWWKETPDSPQLSSDFHIHTVAQAQNKQMKENLGGGAEGMATESSCCSDPGSGLSFQHPHGGSNLSAQPCFDLHGHSCDAHTYACKTCTHNKNVKREREIPTSPLSLGQTKSLGSFQLPTQQMVLGMDSGMSQGY